MTKDELIAALEAATGPSRELDYAIDECVGLPANFCGKKVKRWKPATAGDYWNCMTADGYVHFNAKGCAKFSASIDAALTLVPEGWWAKTVRGEDGHGYAAISTDSSAIKFRCDRAATPAIALCIAALRARP